MIIIKLIDLKVCVCLDKISIILFVKRSESINPKLIKIFFTFFLTLYFFEISKKEFSTG